MQKDNKIKYVIYARKSTEDDSRQVQSINDQLDKLRELAEKKNLHIVKEFKEDKSAKKPNNRAQFSEMIKRINNGEANGILSWKLNRLSRNPLESGIIQQLLHDGKLISIQTYDKEYTIKDNDILFGVETGSASQFIKELSKDVKRGLESKVKKGWRPGNAPLGYVNNKHKEKGEKDISPNPDTFPLVRKIFDLMLTGNYIPSQLHRIANDELGLRTRKTKRKGGDKLSLSHMYRILSNPFYAGLFNWDGQKFMQGKHKPMITLEEYDKVQTLLGRKGNPRPKNYRFAFTGTIKCGECGGAITAEIKKKLNKKTGNIKEYTYYHCTRRKKDIKCNQRKVISAEELQKQIEIEIAKVTILPEFLSLALKELDSRTDRELEIGKKAYDAQMKNLEENQEQIRRLIKMAAKGLISEEDFKTAKEELLKEQKSINSKLQTLDKNTEKLLELTEETFNFATYAHNAFLKGDWHKKKEILSALGSNFLLKDGKLTLESHPWFIPIKNSYPQIEAEYIRFELDKTPLEKLDTEQLKVFRKLNYEWSGR